MTTTETQVDRLSATLSLSFAEAVAHSKEAFKEEGFGVLTEIDVQKTLQDKIGFQMDAYCILGMCNPSLAARAITVAPDIGLFLPCNVLVAQRGACIEVSAQDPLFMIPMVSNEALGPIAHEVRDKLGRALKRLKDWEAADPLG